VTGVSSYSTVALFIHPVVADLFVLQATILYSREYIRIMFGYFYVPLGYYYPAFASNFEGFYVAKTFKQKVLHVPPQSRGNALSLSAARPLHALDQPYPIKQPHFEPWESLLWLR
jgi:hypothetical protein